MRSIHLAPNDHPEMCELEYLADFRTTGSNLGPLQLQMLSRIVLDLLAFEISAECIRHKKAHGERATGKQNNLSNQS